MQTLKARLSIATALLTLSSGCAVPIHDAQFCSPLPGGLGAVCDSFLTSNQQILTQDQWVAMQISWQSQGQAIECTTSQTFADIKAELEKLCSESDCSYPVQEAIKGFKKISTLGK